MRSLLLLGGPGSVQPIKRNIKIRTAFSPDFTNPLISERTQPSHTDEFEISDIFKSTSKSKRKVIKFKIPDEKS